MFVDETTTFWTDGIPITFYEIMDWYENYCRTVPRNKRKVSDPHFDEKTCYMIAKLLVKGMNDKLGIRIGNNYFGNDDAEKELNPAVKNTISTFVNDPETAGLDWFDQDAVMKKALGAMEKKYKEEQKRQQEAADFWKKQHQAPPPLQPPKPAPVFNWRKVLGFGPNEVVNEDTIKRYYRKEAMKRHPDKKGGSAALIIELFKARDLAYRFIGKDPP